MKQKLIDFYLDFCNNYLTIDKFSESYNLSYEDCLTLVEMGKKFHEEIVERLKEIENRIKKEIETKTN